MSVVHYQMPTYRLLHKYIEQFTIMANQTESLPDHVKYMFIKGLNENIAANVNFRRPNSLIEAIQLAKDFEESFPTKTNEISKNSEINLIRSYKSKQRISQNVCFQCGRTGHRRAKCPQLNKANKYDKQKKKQKNAFKKKICTYCGKTSHVESECFKKQREELNKNNDRNNYKNNYKNDRNENRQVENNEDVEMEINSIQRSKQSQIRTITFEPKNYLLKTIVKINGFKQEMIFDSGATSSVISESLANQYGIEMSG